MLRRPGDSTGAPFFGSLSCVVFRPESRLRFVERRRMPVALAAGQLELKRKPSEPAFSSFQEDATDIPIAVEHVEVVIVPVAAFAGDVGAANDQGGIGHLALAIDVLSTASRLAPIWLLETSCPRRSLASVPENCPPLCLLG